jgi:hypothetical protein
MFIIGCDFHSRFQQIAMLDSTTGEVINRRLEHENGEAKKFYATLPSPARVGDKVRVVGVPPWPVGLPEQGFAIERLLFCRA